MIWAGRIHVNHPLVALNFGEAIGFQADKKIIFIAWPVGDGIQRTSVADDRLDAVLSGDQVFQLPLNETNGSLGMSFADRGGFARKASTIKD